MKVFSAISEVADISELDDAGEPIVTYCFRYAGAGSDTARSLSWYGIFYLARKSLMFLLIMCGFTGAAYYWEKGFYDGAVHTIAKVTSYQESRDSKSNKMYSMELEYITQDGRRIRTTEDSSSNMKFHDIGDSVEIYYDPKNPTDFRPGGMAKFFWTKALAVFGTFGAFMIILSGFKEFRTQNFTKYAQFYAATVESIHPTPLEYSLVSIIAATPANMKRRYVSPPFTKTPTGLTVGQSLGVWVDPKLSNENYAIIWQPDKWAMRYAQNGDNASGILNSGNAMMS